MAPAALALVALCAAMAASAAAQQGRSASAERQILEIQQLIARGDLAGARTLLGDAVRRYPRDAGLDNLLGIVDAQEGNYEAAERSFNRAVARAPRFTGAYLNLGRLYIEHAARDEAAVKKALDVYGRVLQYEPGNMEANYQSSVLLLRQGAYKASLERLSRLPSEVLGSAQALSVRCAGLAGLGDRSRADEAAAQLVSHPDFSEPDVITVLPALTASGRGDLAVKLIEGLAARQPLSPEMTHRLGLAYEGAGRLADARAALERSVVASPPPADVLVDLARVARKQKDFQGALGYLGHARDLEPKSAAVHFYFGLACGDLNLVAEARNAFGKALELEPENPAYNYAMGIASAFARDPTEALPYLEKYVQLEPRDPRGKLALGAVLVRAKQFDAATARLREALASAETATTARFYLGSAAREAGRVEEAIPELEKALHARPDYADALAELGQCYMALRDYERAGEYLRRALEVDTNHYAANFNLLTLYARTKDERRAAQEKRFDAVRELREARAQEFLRAVELRPHDAP